MKCLIFALVLLSLCALWSVSTLITASILTHAKEKASEAGAKHADWGMGFASEASKKSRETVDSFAIKWSY